MANKNVIFILGAGASVPYGLPTSWELKDQILTLLRTNNHEFDQAGFLNRDQVDFARRFVASNLTSIDFFLNKKGNESFSQLGKVAICRAILNQERYDSLLGTLNFVNGLYSFNHESRALKQGWYSHLWNQLELDLDNFHKNSRFSFITFNYDRSLDHFFYTSFCNTFSRAGLNEKEIAQYLSHLKIIHVHGMLAPLGHEGAQKGKDNCISYGEETDLHKLKRLSKNIKIINESKESDSEFQSARDLILQTPNAEIVFLGFGFHPDNLERLYFDHLKRPDGKGGLAPSIILNREIHATITGMSQGALHKAMSLMGTHINTYDIDCGKFIKQYI